ncbi:MAG: nitronate monooxygenase [Verrucomicrobia bacterium]|nr:nitronate monooxygenase [Verrucomicrobiota bacterium]
MLRTHLCELLGIEVPILSAPMGPNISGPELAAAVSNAGGLGIMQAQLAPPPLLRQEIYRLRELTDKPFGVNFILHFPHQESIAVCLQERVPVLMFFWGDPSPFVARAHAAGAKVLHQVGSVEGARQATRAGVDVLVAQGVEAGGHLAGEVTTMALVPRVVDAVAPTPMVAADGIADARGLVAALASGAEAVMLGTRFLATPEANAHPVYKMKLVAATEEDTVRTTLFGHEWPNAPHRTLRTPFVREWLGQEARAQESRPDEPLIGQTRVAGQTIPLPRFMGLPPCADASGDVESMNFLAGQSVGLVHEIKPAAAIVCEMVEQATQIIGQRLNNALGAASV